MVQIIQTPIQNLQTVQQRWVSRMTPRTRNSRLAAVYTPSCCSGALADRALCGWVAPMPRDGPGRAGMPKQRSSFRSEEHTSELQSLMRISYAVFCLKKKNEHNDRLSTKTKQHHKTQ